MAVFERSYVLRPRVKATLTVPLFGSTYQKQTELRDTGAIEIPLTRISHLQIERNDHNHADTASLTTDWRETGLDPRLMSSARIAINAWGEGADGMRPAGDDLRFVGIMSKPARSIDEGSGFDVNLDFIDYTSFFLNQKRFASEGVPLLDMTYVDAWNLICDHVGFWDVQSGAVVSSVAELKDRVRFQGVDPGLTIGGHAPKRLRQFGIVQVKPDANAWDVWNQCCGMNGLITYIDRDEVVITTALDYYTKVDPPVFAIGGLVESLNEESDSTRAHKGVGITSFEPLGGSTLESFYPRPGDPRLQAKRTKAAVTAKSKAKAAAAQAARVAAAKENVTLDSEAYEWFEVPGIMSQGELDALTQRVFEEYSRQQLEGHFKPEACFVPTVTGESFDVLSLGAGQGIVVQFDQDGGGGQTPDFLVGLGYAPQTADLISKNRDSIKGLGNVRHVKQATFTWDTDDTGGKLDAEITFINVIDAFGNGADPDTGLSVEALGNLAKAAGNIVGNVATAVGNIFNTSGDE